MDLRGSNPCCSGQLQLRLAGGNDEKWYGRDVGQQGQNGQHMELGLSQRDGGGVLSRRGI